MKRNLKVYGSSSNVYEYDPFILLKGKWLKNTGFKIGDQIEVEYENDQIIIRKR